jgi:hypothetical protein
MKGKHKATKPGLRYSSVTLSKFPPGYQNAKVIGVVKAKGKNEVRILIQIERVVKL